MRSAYVCIAIVILAASSAWSQGNPVGAAPPQAPIGHRQPTVKDLPPDVARDERPADVSRGEQGLSHPLKPTLKDAAEKAAADDHRSLTPYRLQKWGPTCGQTLDRPI